MSNFIVWAGCWRCDVLLFWTSADGHCNANAIDATEPQYKYGGSVHAMPL